MNRSADARRLTEFAAAPEEPAAEPAARWHKAPPLHLSGEASAEDALVEALRNGREHLAANRSCVLERAHEEGVHQMRVATRRLRSRLALYEDLVPIEARKPLQTALKWLIGRLGPARDWDVFLLEVVPPATERFPDDAALAHLVAAAEARRERGYARAAKALASERYAAIEAVLAEGAEGRPWQATALRETQRAGLAAPVAAFADGIARQRHEALLAKGEHFAAMSAEERHSLRIEIKKVRYAAEFFASLYPAKRVRAYLGALKDLQDDLGAANDRVVARDLMMRLAQRAPKAERLTLAYAAGLVMAAQPPLSSSEAESVARWRAFTECPNYWQEATPVACTPA